MTDSDERPFMDLARRDALAILAALPLSLGLGPGSLVARAWQEIRQHLPADGAPYTPRFFTADEWRTVRVLADDVIPRDERSGSATDAGVPEFMDAIMMAQPESQRTMRVGLQWIDVESHQRFGQVFAAATAQQRASLLDDIAWPERTPLGMEVAVSFFSAFRDLTASGFWSSRIGVADLQYMGNAAVHDWQGCPAPALARLGVSY